MTMEPGYELDKAVAEACGIEGAIRMEGLRAVGAFWRYIDTPTNKTSTPFCPSIDWNDAMLAAEKVGLWDWQYGNLTRRGSDGVYQLMCTGSNPHSIVGHTSGPTCVSLGILKLKGKADAEVG